MRTIMHVRCVRREPRQDVVSWAKRYVARPPQSAVEARYQEIVAELLADLRASR